LRQHLELTQEDLENFARNFCIVNEKKGWNYAKFVIVWTESINLAGRP
jgi:hypothetical protein